MAQRDPMVILGIEQQSDRHGGVDESERATDQPSYPNLRAYGDGLVSYGWIIKLVSVIAGVILAAIALYIFVSDRNYHGDLFALAVPKFVASSFGAGLCVVTYGFGILLSAAGEAAHALADTATSATHMKVNVERMARHS